MANNYFGCLVYADDIILLSHSVNTMRSMFAICEQFAFDFDMKFNTQKAVANPNSNPNPDALMPISLNDPHCVLVSVMM